MRKYYYFISLILFAILLNGCSSPLFYQVYDTTLSDNMQIKEGQIYYEDENCQITYNLWGDKGVIGFAFYNKTDYNIYLNLEECFFVKNGVAYDYYQNKILGFPKANVSSTNNNNKQLNYIKTSHFQAINSYQSNNSNVYKMEKKVICIPSQTLKYINEYSVVDELYRSCNLYRFPDEKPSRKFKNKEEFTDENSPLKFGNIITYSLDDKLKSSIKVDNIFIVKTISNYRSVDILKSEQVKFCNEVSPIPNTIMVFTNSINAANKFYIQYTKTLRDQFTH
ncbi:MAG: hypothetical protein WC135_02125 [Bacteroidales bacterium]